MQTPHDIISSWLDLDDEFLQQELQHSENHFNLDTHPFFSSLPIPEGSPFCNFNAEQAGLEPNDGQQCVELDICDTFLDSYDEFGLISPTDQSPDNNDINDPFCETTIINLLDDVEMSEPMVTKANAMESSKTDHGDINKDATDVDHPKRAGPLNSKNMVSERNRRKRQSKQLLSLRALVPNITKMDKRSVLVDALSYLKHIHEETERLQKDELKDWQPRSKLSDLKESSQDNPSGTLRIPRTTSILVAHRKNKTQIIEIETEKIGDKKLFVVKITCKSGVGVGSDVLRLFGSLDFEITHTALEQLQTEEVRVTIFLRVRKKGKMTERKLKDCITSIAVRTGLSLQNKCGI